MLFVGSLAFATLVVTLRLRHVGRSRAWDRMVRTWEPAMLEVLSGAAPPGAVFERVKRGQEVAFLTFLITYVRRLRGAEQAMVRRMAEPYLPAAVPLVRRGGPESRANAVMLLARMGMPRYADVVAEALADESPVVAMIAAHSLFRPEHERHFDEVLVNLPRFSQWSRGFLAGMLAAGGPAAAPLLERILVDSTQSGKVRSVAADALLALNDLDAVPAATALLEVESDREVLAGCLRILKKLGHAEHVPLVRRLARSEDSVVRSRAVSALGTIGGPEESTLLLESLDDESFWVSLEAARSLMALGEDDTLRRLAGTPGPWSTLARQVLSE